MAIHIRADGMLETMVLRTEIDRAGILTGNACALRVVATATDLLGDVEQAIQVRAFVARAIS